MRRRVYRKRAIRPRYGRKSIMPAGQVDGGLERFRRWRVHQWVVALEPWGILAAVLALIVATTQFWVEYEDRVNEREVRAWQLVTTFAPGNSGKRAALEYLNQEDGFLCFEWLRGRLYRLHGLHDGKYSNTGCFVLLKRRTKLVGIDLSIRNNSRSNGRSNGVRGVFLERINLARAFLQDANMAGAEMTFADLTGAYLSGADLRDAILAGANLKGARLTETNLKGASFLHADLTGAHLKGADLEGASLMEANLMDAKLTAAKLKDANLWGADLRGADLTGVLQLDQNQLNFACGDEHTRLPEGFTIAICSER